MNRKYALCSLFFLLFFCKSSLQANSLLNLNVNEPEGTLLKNVLDPVTGLLKHDQTTTSKRTPTLESLYPTTTVGTTTEGTTPSPIESFYSTTSMRTTTRMKSGSNCGRRQIKHTGLITSGSPTSPGDWPWHVAIFKMKTSSSEQKYICGGTLLSRTRILTAGHCVVENNAVVLPERLYAVMGKHNLVGGDIASQEKSVFEIILHPEFSSSTLEHDIAMLKLSSRVTFSDYVQPICLWDKGDTRKSLIIGTFGVIVGWGFTQEEHLATELMKATIPVKDDLTCIRSNPSFYAKYLTDNTYCAGFGNGTSACNGDSGGGMYFSIQDGDDEIWRLRGIVSLSVSRRDKNICDPNYYTLFTDVGQYLDFVDDHLSAKRTT